MSQIKKLFRELYYEVFKISLVNASADSIIFFLLALNITHLFNLSTYITLAATLLWLIGDVAFRMKKTTLRRIEHKNPNIRDILRTAKDHYNREDFMVLAMFEDLIVRMKTVSAGSILNSKEMILKVLIMCALSFSVIMLAGNDIRVPESVFDPSNYKDWFSRPGAYQREYYGIEFNMSDEDIYGDSSLALLGNDEIELAINPDVNKIDFDNVKEVEEKIFERGTFPDEVVAVSDAASEEKLPKESKIAIAYNLKLKEKG
ncbi:hypothetical protein ACFL0V_00715 [Nanoarchaeota archaeon]